MPVDVVCLQRRNTAQAYAYGQVSLPLTEVCLITEDAEACAVLSQGPMNLHGLEEQVDVMIEAKCKERALLRFREAMTRPPSKDTVMAMKLV